jgi:hypothetical protein
MGGVLSGASVPKGPGIAGCPVCGQDAVTYQWLTHSGSIPFGFGLRGHGQQQRPGVCYPKPAN